MAGYLLVTTTTDKREDADAIARALVEGQLAACVQVVGPIGSTYRWQGKVEVAEEWLCLIKTSQEGYGEVERAILDLHSYETPEVIALSIMAGSEGYMEWLRENTGLGDT